MYDDAYYETLRPTSGMARFVDDARDAMVARLVRRFAPTGDLLDVGCGRGDLLSRFRASHSISGMELSEAGLGLASDRLPGARLAAGDIQEDLPFDTPFEAITAINVIEHLDRPTAGAHNLAKHQPKGGLLVVHLPTVGNAVQRWFYEGSYDQDPTHVYRPSGSDVVRLFETAGYRHLRSGYAPFIPLRLWRHVPFHPAFMAAFARE